MSFEECRAMNNAKLAEMIAHINVDGSKQDKHSQKKVEVKDTFQRNQFQEIIDDNDSALGMIHIESRSGELTFIKVQYDIKEDSSPVKEIKVDEINVKGISHDKDERTFHGVNKEIVVFNKELENVIQDFQVEFKVIWNI